MRARRASDRHPEFAIELPRFVEEIKQIFEPEEIRAYLDEVRRVGALWHTASDEAYEEGETRCVISFERSFMRPILG
jgi:hypothetical protein